MPEAYFNHVKTNINLERLSQPFQFQSTLKMPNCPLTDEWIKKIYMCVCVFTYTMEYYFVIKNAICSNRVDLETIILSQTKTNTL